VSKDLTDIVLLGHSFAGTIIAKVAEAIPDRIRRLIFFDAFVLNDGESLRGRFKRVSLSLKCNSESRSSTPEP
jgi:pimeloyl-ACP methyl ester carboxylesterase